ncbi:MAG: hypothetical protein ACLSHO_10950 [Dysosmobacter sp.]
MGTPGKDLIVGGAVGSTAGAPYLAASAAVRTAAGWCPWAYRKVHLARRGGEVH